MMAIPSNKLGQKSKLGQKKKNVLQSRIYLQVLYKPNAIKIRPSLLKSSPAGRNYDTGTQQF
jgi:hypothetical protein